MAETACHAFASTTQVGLTQVLGASGENMGYLISGLFFAQRPAEPLLRQALPSSISYSVYRHPTADVYAVDGFRPTKPSNYPLSTLFPSADLPLELGAHLKLLSGAYEEARAAGEANGIKRAYVNLAEIVSSALGTSVLAICTDDDETDFACVAAAGIATEVWARCGERSVRLSGGALSWSEADAPVLHANAAQAFGSFTGTDPIAFGFSTWDPPHEYGLVLLGT